MSQKGSVLILSFFVLLLISIFAISVGYSMRQKIQVISRLESRQKLRFLGDAAVKKSVYALALRNEEKKNFDALGQPWNVNESEFRGVLLGDGEFSVSYPVRSSSKNLETGKVVEKQETRYGLTDEESKINLKRVKSPEILARLFADAGKLSTDDARMLTEALLDWTDEDSDTRYHGAEDNYYKKLKNPYVPRNGPLVALQEIKWIKGMTPELYEKLVPYLTIESTGAININTASKPVLNALGLSPMLCDKIIKLRKGRDQQEGTEDDRAFEDISTVVQSLSDQRALSETDKAALEAAINAGILTVKSSNFSANVEAHLKYGRQGLRVFAILDGEGEIKRWEEEFVASPS